MDNMTGIRLQTVELFRSFRSRGENDPGRKDSVTFILTNAATDREKANKVISEKASELMFEDGVFFEVIAIESSVSPDSFDDITRRAYDEALKEKRRAETPNGRKVFLY